MSEPWTALQVVMMPKDANPLAGMVTLPGGGQSPLYSTILRKVSGNMTKEEAIGIAVEYLRSRPDLSETSKLEPEDAILLKACYRPELNATADAWIVHFPLILPDEVLCQEPSTRGILVDTVTGEVSVPSLL